MENRLRKLLEQNSEKNRGEVAEGYRKQGKHIIGIVDGSFPEEIIHAAGMLPWRITGTWSDNVAMAHSHRSKDTDDYSNHIFQSLLEDKLAFLDGIIISCEYDDIRRLRDNWDYVKKSPITYLLYVPCKDSEITREAFMESLKTFISEFEKYSGVKITEDALEKSIKTYNKWRTLLMKVYELRKREVPPISGSEALKLVTASFVMPKEEFVRELEVLLPYLEERKTSLPHLQPRLLVSGDKVDNPAYLELIEDMGCLIAMDDLDTGSRYFWKTTNEELNPLEALVDRYMTRPPSPLIAEWSKYTDHVISWAKEYNVAGVLNLPHQHSLTRWMVTPYFRDKILEAGIPVMSFKVEYHLANQEQLKTRIGAFLEVLSTK
ncbi:MAG: 2-hydroxyacyl-CoA dehydratase [Dehalococcoidales bacterium]|nr:2-hydroxyacyl-CoA dehydratase [Dehalococcoidales bacterium]